MKNYAKIEREHIREAMMSVQTEKGVSNTKKEFAFTSSSIILQVSRGILVGIIVGAIVGSFRCGVAW